MARPAFWQVVRTVPGRIRPWLRIRRLAGLTALLGTASLVAIVGEAAVRARLDPAAARVPSTLYARPVPWEASRPDRQPVSIGTVAPALQERREPVPLSEMAATLIEAVLAVEDQRFYEHRGLDARRVVGAALANVRAGEIRQGGSTITQQLAKNLFLSARRTPLRKLREAAMAVTLEDRYDKPSILEAYLNEVYLGQDGPAAIHGVGAAARYYFGKDAADLTLSESALLAGMIRAPNRYTPVRHPERARARRDLVLALMLDQERIAEQAARTARRARIRISARTAQAADARYFRDFAASRLAAEWGHEVPERGTAVYTTLDAGLQQAAEQAVRDGLTSLGRRGRGAQAALVALDPRTGEILAMVGGRDYAASQFNRAVDAKRQPGSAFKPVVALAALSRDRGGEPAFTLASELRDEPLRVETPAGVWEPDNYDERFRGPVSLREALEQSLNVPFARLGLAIGPKRIVRVGEALGIESRLQAVPSIALGASEVSPLELVRAYGVLAAGGIRAETRAIRAVERVGDGPRDARRRPPQQVVDPAEAYLVTSALEGAVARGTGRALRRMSDRGDLAGKSGTSSGWRDGWFVAYTPAIAVGVWVGNDDGSSLGLSGSRSALPIVARFLAAALRRSGPARFDVPEGVEFVRVAERSGSWSWSCAGEPEVFLAGTAPEDRCGGWWRRDRWITQLEDRSRGLRDELAGVLAERGEELLELLEAHGEEVIALLAERLTERARSLRSR